MTVALQNAELGGNSSQLTDARLRRTIPPAPI
jgi:hypothetical protein